MRIRWTEGADSNLDQVEEYIAQDNPPAAVATVNKIIDSAQMLADYPTIGNADANEAHVSLLLQASRTSSFMPYSVGNSLFSVYCIHL